MEKAFKEALDANNLPRVRELLIETITNEADDTDHLETLKTVIETTPGLFDDDNGKFYAPTAADMTPALTMELIDDLKSNFSLEKFRLLTEVYALRVDGYMPDDEVNPVKASEPSGSKTSGGDKPKCSCGKVAGWVILILGLAGAIVGLCVPVKFLLGLGIGVFMLGLVLLYTNMTRN